MSDAQAQQPAPIPVQNVVPVVPMQPTAQPAQPTAQPAAQPAQQPAQQQPAQPDPAAGGDAFGQALDGMTADQLDNLVARIEQTRANRPPSLAQALQQLQGQLTETHRAKESAVEQRKEGAAEADRLEAAIGDLHRTIRRTELVEAATAAGFASPAVIADHLANTEGDVAELVTKLAATGAFAMRKPAQTAQVGGSGTGTHPDIDPGMAAMIAEIKQAHGRA